MQLVMDDGAVEARSLSCRVLPSGAIEVSAASASDGPPLDRTIRARLIDAFERGRGDGVLHLATITLETELEPGLAFFREVGKRLLTETCGAFDPTAPHELTIPGAPEDDLAALALSVPPMQGAELVSVETLAAIWREAGAALAREAAFYENGLEGYLDSHASVFHAVGRVCLHLAENANDPEYPFAFVATYVDRVSRNTKTRHVVLGQALEQYAGAKNRRRLIALLAPLSRAAEESALLRDLVDSGDVYHPMRWSAREAHQFLSEVELYERAGLIVRVPAFWSSKGRPRPRVTVSVGGNAPSRLGTDALLDFEVGLTLDGESLTREEIETLLASTDGLVWLRGKWVEVDAEELRTILAAWHEVEEHARDGSVTFGEAMRMLAGAPVGTAAAAEVTDARREWSEVVAGDWLASKLEALRASATDGGVRGNAGLKAELRPYQKRGVQWLEALRALELGGCLADDMGLGKTIQVIGVLARCKRRREDGTDLLVVPASLIDNWLAEIERFAPGLSILVAHPSRIRSTELRDLPSSEVDAHDAVLTTYGTLARLEWMRSHTWRNVVIDEAQAIKNPAAKQARAVKALDARWRVALTGTPVENRLGDLWSIFDFLSPGLLGSAKSFTAACKAMAASERGYAPLRKLIQPYVLRRLKTDRSIIDDLPDKTEVTTYCFLSKRQAALYARSVDEMKRALAERQGIERRGLVLAYLMRFKQICNHPSQWLGDGRYDPAGSGKLARLRELLEPVVARQDKVLVFTQFREMTGPLATFLAEVFGRPGLVLHGGTAVRKRQTLVRAFQEDERVPFMVLSLKAGGTGLNLTAASHVIHFDRWWNPAVEDQATDRAFRIGQKKNVLVHKLVCRGTVEERIDELIAGKRKLAGNVIEGGVETALTEMTDDELMAMVSLDLRRATDG